MPFPPQLPADKANHWCYGSGLAAIGSSAAIIARHPELAGYAGLAAAAVFALAKEALDAYLNHKATGDWRNGPHGVELNDWLATAAGGATVAGPVFLATSGAL